MKHFFEVVADKMEDRFTRNGEMKKALEIAKIMKDKGKSIDEIMEFTKLTVDDILRL